MQWHCFRHICSKYIFPELYFIKLNSGCFDYLHITLWKYVCTVLTVNRANSFKMHLKNKQNRGDWTTVNSLNASNNRYRYEAFIINLFHANNVYVIKIITAISIYIVRILRWREGKMLTLNPVFIFCGENPYFARSSWLADTFWIRIIIIIIIIENFITKSEPL